MPIPASRPSRSLSILLAAALLTGCQTEPIVATGYDYSGNLIFQNGLLAAGRVSEFKKFFETELARGGIEAGTWEFALNEAVGQGNKELFSYLASYAGRVSRADLRQVRAGLLASAARKGRYDMLNWLLYDPAWAHIGFDLNESAETGSTPLNEAIRVLDFKMVDWLMEQGADPERVDKSGDNALNFAVSLDAKSLYKRLLAKGMSLNPDKARPPLLTAISLQRQDWIESLLEAGADINASYSSPQLSSQPETALSTALGTAMNSSSIQSPTALLELLFEKGLDIRSKGNTHAWLNYLDTSYSEEPPPYYGLSARVYLDYLLRLKPDLDASDLEGRTALMILARRGYFRTLRRLLEAGADAKRVNNQGKTLLMYAVESGSLELVQFLIDRGLDPAQRDDQGLRARDYAAVSSAEIYRYLTSIPAR